MKSWIETPDNSDFTLYNIPFGIIKHNNKKVVATIIGNTVIDLHALYNKGLLSTTYGLHATLFANDFLNDFIAEGKPVTNAVRARIIDLFNETNTEHRALLQECLLPVDEVQNCMPVRIGDYTDFFSSIDHATNTGMMFRDPANALLPNWKHLPVGYHGRSSSIVESGINFYRPKGQSKADDQTMPSFAPCKTLDFELEMGFIIGKPTAIGDSITTANADEHIFGFCLFNDWSARDIQKWEYVPLGPFLGKNFFSSISPWIVTIEALAPFRVPSYEQMPQVLPYLAFEGNNNFDVNLQVFIQPENSTEKCVSESNFKYMYWNVNQQLAHHTVNGCNVNVGDMMASGTISGPEPTSYGSMLEISWGGKRSITMNDGTERKFIQDNDTVIMRGYASKNGIRVGFGEVKNKVLAAK
jgi:fumarylacetoacetase